MLKRFVLPVILLRRCSQKFLVATDKNLAFLNMSLYAHGRRKMDTKYPVKNNSVSARPMRISYCCSRPVSKEKSLIFWDIFTEFIPTEEMFLDVCRNIAQFFYAKEKPLESIFSFKFKGFYWSGRPDLNRRPLAPQASALPGCATPRFN